MATSTITGRRPGPGRPAAAHTHAVPAPAAPDTVDREQTLQDPLQDRVRHGGSCSSGGNAGVLAEALALVQQQIHRAEIAHAQLRWPRPVGEVAADTAADTAGAGEAGAVGAGPGDLGCLIAGQLQVAEQAVATALALTATAQLQAELVAARDLARRIQLTLAVAHHAHLNPRPEVPPRTARIARDVLAATIDTGQAAPTAAPAAAAATAAAREVQAR
jgi:hypothetical protein